MNPFPEPRSTGPRPASVPAYDVSFQELETPHDLSQDAALDTLWMDLQAWGRYEVLELLGEGGMGRVFKANDPRLRRPLALKFLHTRDPKQTRLLLLEAQIQASLNHDHICKVYEVGIFQGHPYIAMEYIPGQTLDEAMTAMTIPERVRLLAKVARAAHHAHRQQLIHRDLKPGNVLVISTDSGEYKPYLMDFGLAVVRETEDSRGRKAAGTPYYMAPEQAHGSQPLDHRADVYSLGAMLYTLLTNQTPAFPAGNSSAKTHARLKGSRIGHTSRVKSHLPLPIGSLGAGKTTRWSPLLRTIHNTPLPLVTPRLSFPRDLETIFLKATQQDPHRRYTTALAFAVDLERYLDLKPIHARRATMWERMLKASQRMMRDPLLRWALPATVIIIFVATGFGLLASWKAKRQMALATQLGMKINQIEHIMNLAYLRPKHDLSRDQSQARAILAGIQQDARDLGSWAEGPTCYALGKGYLVLRDYPLAHHHLEQAWNAGYRNRESAIALAECLLESYRQAIEEVRRIPEPSLRESRKQALIRTLREPASRLLDQAFDIEPARRATLEAEALLYSERPGEALAKIDAAVALDPNSREADVVRGRILVEMGNALDLESHTRAEKQYRLALDAFLGIAERERSDPDVYKSIANIYADLLDLARYSQADPIPIYEQAIAFNAIARELDPHDPEPWRNQALAASRLAYHRQLKGAYCLDTYDQAIQFAEQALSLDPQSAPSNARLAYCLIGWVEAASSLGKPVRPAIERGIACIQKALALEPGNLKYLWELATSYCNLASEDEAAGGDPRPALQQAIQANEEALKPNPPIWPKIFSLQEEAYARLGTFEMEHGQDPLPDFNRALAFARKALQTQNPVMHMYNVSAISLLKAKQEWATGVIPSESLAESIRAAREAIRLQPTINQGLQYLSSALVFQAKVKLESSLDPSPELKEAEKVSARFLKLSPDNYNQLIQNGELNLLKARWEGRGHRPVVPWLMQARTDFRKAYSQRKDLYEPHLELAKCAVASLELNPASLATTKAMWKEGLSEIDQAIRINLKLPEIYAVKAQLLAWKLGHAEGNETLSFRREARENLHVALQGNPFLKREYEPLSRYLSGAASQ